MCLNVPDLAQRRLAHGEIDGFEYEVVVNHRGYRCGYIRVLPGHPWYEKPYPEASVHGGITFADYGTACATHGPEAEWWVGFDCAHGCDMPDPALLEKLAGEERIEAERYQRLVDEYELDSRLSGFRKVRTQAYVMAQIRSLVKQAKAAA